MSIKGVSAVSPQNSLEGGAVDPTLSWSTDSGVKKHIDVTLNTAHFKLSIRVQSCPPSNVEADDRRKDGPDYGQQSARRYELRPMIEEREQRVRERTFDPKHRDPTRAD